MQELEDKVNKVRSAVSWAPLTAQSLSLEAAKLLTLRVLKQVRLCGPHGIAAFRSRRGELGYLQLVALMMTPQVMEEKLDEKNVQLAQVLPKGGYSMLSDADLKALIAQIEPGASLPDQRR